MTKTLSDIIELPELLLKKESGYMTDIIFLIYKIFLIEYLQNNFSKIYGIYLISGFIKIDNYERKYDKTSIIQTVLSYRNYGI